MYHGLFTNLVTCTDYMVKQSIYVYFYYADLISSLKRDSDPSTP